MGPLGTSIPQTLSEIGTPILQKANFVLPSQYRLVRPAPYASVIQLE